MLNFYSSKYRKSEREPVLALRLAAAFALYTLQSVVFAGGHVGVSDLLGATLDHHPSLRASTAKSTAAQSLVDAAKWQFWPTPSIGFERLQSGRDQGLEGDKTIGVLRLQQPLWTGGRLSSGLQKAQSSALQAEAEVAEVKQSLGLRVIQAWSEAVVSIRKLEAQQKSLQRHQRLLLMVERRLAEGASALSDVALARSRIELLQAEVRLLEAQLDSALDKLRLLTGRPIGARDLAWEHDAQPVARLTLADLVDRAKAVSPQLYKALQAAEVAQADVSLAKAALLPEVALRYEYQQGNFSVANASNISRVFVTVNAALGAGLSSLSGVNTAAAQLIAVQEQVVEQEQALSEQVQLDFTLLQAAQARIRGLALAVRATDDVLDSYERQFLAGRKQWLDLMNAAREQAQTQSQLADAMGASELSSLRLVLLTGGVDALLQVKSFNSNAGVQR